MTDESEPVIRFKIQYCPPGEEGAWYDATFWIADEDRIRRQYADLCAHLTQNQWRLVKRTWEIVTEET